MISEQIHQTTVTAKCQNRRCDWKENGLMYFFEDGTLMQTGENNIAGFCQLHHAQFHWEHPPHHQFTLYNSDEEEAAFLVTATSIATEGVYGDFLEKHFSR